MLEENNRNEINIRKIDNFLNITLSKLGFNLANLGTRYLREIIKLAYFNNDYDLKYKDLCDELSKKSNISFKKIDSNIYSSINSINITITKNNFKDIFNIDFDYFYISPKKLTILLLNYLSNCFNL